METVVFATLVLQVTDFLRELANFRSNLSSVVTQATAWIAGIILVVLGAHAAVTAGLVLPGSGQALGTLDGPSQILVGLLVASLGSTVVDVKQALDGSDSAAKPPLIGPPPASGT
jgi:hypothetical protein